MLLTNGFEVTAVEPSGEMRQECDVNCAGYQNYVSLAGTAESIPVESQSASLITAAQSFHWFNPLKARNECKRVLHPHGKVAILWNNRDKRDALQQRLTALFSSYGGERFEAQRVGLEREEDVKLFFGKSASWSVFDYEQSLTEEAFVALGRSRSYMPKPGTELDRSAIEHLKALHQEFANGGLAAIRYQTHMYLDVLD
jgi:SAM-dependent methyltransferase